MRASSAVASRIVARSCPSTLSLGLPAAMTPPCSNQAPWRRPLAQRPSMRSPRYSGRCGSTDASIRVPLSYSACSAASIAARSGPNPSNHALPPASGIMSLTLPASLVTCAAPEPSVAALQTWTCPPAILRNSTVLPSRVHCALEARGKPLSHSISPASAMRLAGTEPSDGATSHATS